MTLLWLEGFEGYADFADMSVLTSDIVTVPYNCSNFAYNVPGAYGRNSTRGLRSIGSDRPWYFSISDSQSPSELVFGIAIYKEGINTPTASITYPFLSFRDSAAGGTNISRYVLMPIIILRYIVMPPCSVHRREKQ